MEAVADAEVAICESVIFGRSVIEQLFLGGEVPELEVGVILAYRKKFFELEFNERLEVTLHHLSGLIPLADDGDNRHADAR